MALTNAQRQKLHRERSKHGLLQAIAWVPCALVEYLIDMGALTEEQAADPEEIGNAVATWAIKQAEDVRGRKFA